VDLSGNQVRLLKILLWVPMIDSITELFVVGHFLLSPSMFLTQNTKLEVPKRLESQDTLGRFLELFEGDLATLEIEKTAGYFGIVTGELV
jgi:hypothetical protein